jgi:hypothetical protein
MALWERLEEAAGSEFHEVVALVGGIRTIETAARQLGRLEKLGAAPTDTPLKNEISKLRVALDSVHNDAIQVQRWAEQWQTQLKARSTTDATRGNEVRG